MSDVVFSIMARVGLTPRNLVYKRRVGKSESSDTQNAVDEKSKEKKLLDREDKAAKITGKKPWSGIDESV